LTIASRRNGGFGVNFTEILRNCPAVSASFAQFPDTWKSLTGMHGFGRRHGRTSPTMKIWQQENQPLDRSKQRLVELRGFVIEGLDECQLLPRPRASRCHRAVAAQMILARRDSAASA
jgi:hypothetical protein